MTRDRDPLARPHGATGVSAAFLAHFRLEPETLRRGGDLALLEGISAAFARLPYENLSKILKEESCGDPETALRGPQEVVGGYIRAGSGGTCFALTAALLHIVRALGFDAEPLLADRRYGAATHCALAVVVDGQRHLLDPGFLLGRPLALDGRPREVRTGFNELLLTPRAGGEFLELHTRQDGVTAYRLTYKTAPADESAFLRAWRASFAWDMMCYPVLTCVAGARQKYLQGRRFLVRGSDAVEREELAVGDLAARIAREFGVRADLAAAALRILERRRELRGAR